MKTSEKFGEQPFELGEQQLRAIGYLLEGKTKAETASVLGISLRTLNEWCKQGEFTVQLNAGRHDAFNANRERLRFLAPKALRVLERGLASKDESTRLRVAELVLKTVKLTEIPNPTGPVTIDEFDRDQSYRKAMSDVLDAFNT